METPLLYGIVEEGLHRSKVPDVSNFPFLDTLKIRTFLYLSCDALIKEVDDAFTLRQIKVIDLGKKHWRPHPEWKEVSEDFIKEALEVLIDSSNYPILVSCNTGIYVSGVICGCLRRLMHWNLFSAIQEYRLYAQQRKRLADEQKIEFFDCDNINLPKAPPTWLTTYVDMMREEVATARDGKGYEGYDNVPEESKEVAVELANAFFNPNCRLISKHADMKKLEPWIIDEEDDEL
uniref:Tyrosine phosphatase n=1 Tax=Palpitomonas bilix TaxID=652834 RepID=A0A7S3G1E9_9EUKA|mmetsp:Transcript_2091/g.4276  ORF Transcript_2091/g.4276 Transcript_2091/m.4276 type:complete len:234 (+) Transcript_2091:400-1101(+)